MEGLLRLGGCAGSSEHSLLGAPIFYSCAIWPKRLLHHQRENRQSVCIHRSEYYHREICLVCGLTSQSTVMVRSRRSVLYKAVNQYCVHIISFVTALLEMAEGGV